jgi:hypothetical protein
MQYFFYIDNQVLLLIIFGLLNRKVSSKEHLNILFCLITVYAKYESQKLNAIILLCHLSLLFSKPNIGQAQQTELIALNS